MADIEVEVWDATGNRRVRAELPDDAPVNRVMVVLVEKMSLPRHSPDGQLVSYRFHHKASGRQLLEEETLADAGVKPLDILRIQPEITAGAEPSAGRCGGGFLLRGQSSPWPRR